MEKAHAKTRSHATDHTRYVNPNYGCRLTAMHTDSRIYVAKRPRDRSHANKMITTRSVY